jgi:hypothetical protein
MRLLSGLKVWADDRFDGVHDYLVGPIADSVDVLKFSVEHHETL